MQGTRPVIQLLLYSYREDVRYRKDVRSVSCSAVTKPVVLQGLSQPSPSIVVGEEDFAAVTLFGNTAPASVASVIVAVEISSWQFLVCMCVFTIFSKWLWELRFHLKEVTMD